MNAPNTGTLLISDPFLKDPHFMRTVVLLCEHHEEGSLGFVLNKPYTQTLDELIPEMDGHKIVVHDGGPVQKDTLHFLHNVPHLIPEGHEVLPGVYWGGDFTKVISLIRNKELDNSSIRFFLGYSGWSNGQLDSELKEKSWLTTTASQHLVFNSNSNIIWKMAVLQMDKKYHEIINYPIDPQLN
jgi:putative transcriptional regulator